MPTPTVNMLPGQSVNLNVQPMFQGQPGGMLANPVVWSCNSNLIGINAVLTPNGMNCNVAIPANTVNSGSFSVTATSGSLTATCIIFVNQAADGMEIVASPVQ